MTLNETPKQKWLKLLLMFLVIAGCEAQPQSGLVPSAEVTRFFYEGRILPDFNYYYDGSKMLPRAVIGVHKDYQLVSDIWQAIELTENQLSGWRLDAQIEDIHAGPIGAELTASDGSRVAIWNSYTGNTWSRAEVREDKTVVIYPPSRSYDMLRTTPSIGF